MKIRLTISPNTFAQLCATINQEDTPLGVKRSTYFPEHYGGRGKVPDATMSVITVLRGTAKDSGPMEVDLDIAEVVTPNILWRGGGQDMEKIVLERMRPEVPREKVNALLDVLGIFPRDDGDKIERLKRLIHETYHLATDITHDLRVPGSLPTESDEWRLSMGMGELRMALESVAHRFGLKKYYGNED